MNEELAKMFRNPNDDRLTCLSHWFPIIEAAGLPVPKTTIIRMPREALDDIYNLFDGVPMKGKADATFVEIETACDAMGYPCFLRTGLTSGKHSWKETCFVTKIEDVQEHVINLVEHSELVDLMGLACDVWVVREMLPTTPVAIAPNFRDMPICREFRFFVDGGTLTCFHPYWPFEALEQGGVAIPFAADDGPDFGPLFMLNDDEQCYLSALACRAGAALGGAWSVDLLETTRGWFLTDMAQASTSYHWEGCTA
jgi:hypothetical protein